MVTSINDLRLKLPAALQVTLDCATRLPAIMSFRDTIMNLQMVYYWLGKAIEYMDHINEGQEIITEGEATTMTIIIPSLTTIPAQIDYIAEELDSLVEEIDRYIKEAGLPEGVEMRLRYAFVRANEAKFCNDISKTYYQEYERQLKRRE